MADSPITIEIDVDYTITETEQVEIDLAEMWLAYCEDNDLDEHDMPDDARTAFTQWLDEQARTESREIGIAVAEALPCGADIDSVDVDIPYATWVQLLRRFDTERARYLPIPGQLAIFGGEVAA